MGRVTMDCELPYPPTVNMYWRTWKGRMLISKEGRAYRKAIRSMLLALRTEKATGPLTVSILSHPPDNRRRDLDNILKALLDALQSAGAFDDDSQVEKLTIERGAILKGGMVEVRIETQDATG